jgi:hypothetical protein
VCQVSRRDDFFLYTLHGQHTTRVVIPFVEHRLPDQGIVGVWAGLLHKITWPLPMVGGGASTSVSSLPWGGAQRVGFPQFVLKKHTNHK